MKKILIPIVLSFLPALAWAQNATQEKPLKDWPEPDQVLRLWPGDAPNLVPPLPAEVIVKQRIRNVTQPELWAYFPKEKKPGRAAIIICPGGGYGHLAIGLHVARVIELFHQQDVVVLALKYRTAYGKNNVAADAAADGERGIRLLRLHAQEWGISPSRIMLQGYSAGANVCLNILGGFDDGDPAASDPAERLSSRPDLVALMCLWPQGKTAEHYSLKPHQPPVFIATAEDDTTAPTLFSKEISVKLEAQGSKITWFVVPTGGHGAFHYNVSKGPGAKWPETFLPLIPK